VYIIGLNIKDAALMYNICFVLFVCLKKLYLGKSVKGRERCSTRTPVKTRESNSLEYFSSRIKWKSRRNCSS